MRFKKTDGFLGRISLKFADKKIPKCTMCGTNYYIQIWIW